MANIFSQLFKDLIVRSKTEIQALSTNQNIITNVGSDLKRVCGDVWGCLCRALGRASQKGHLNVVQCLMGEFSFGQGLINDAAHLAAGNEYWDVVRYLIPRVADSQAFLLDQLK